MSESPTSSTTTTMGGIDSPENKTAVAAGGADPHNNEALELQLKMEDAAEATAAGTKGKRDVPSSSSSSSNSSSKTTTTTLLPPCRVCGDTASGFHYGAVTCNACKGFFLRSLDRKDGYSCHKDERCQVFGRTKHKAKCPSCRWGKMQTLGMSKDATQNGRYSVAKRTQLILEVKGAKGKPPTEQSSADIHSMVSHLRVDERGNSRTDSNQAQMAVADTQAKMAAAVEKQRMEEANNDADMCMDLSLKTDPRTQQVNEVQTQCTLDTSGARRKHNARLEAQKWSGDHNVHGDQDSQDKSDCQPMEVTAEDPAVVGVEVDVLSEDEMTRIISHLSDVYMRNTEVTPEFLATRAAREQKFIEARALRREMFGADIAQPLPIDEYKRISALTGMDADGRSQLIQLINAKAEVFARQMVNIAKALPRFRSLCMDDQLAVLHNIMQSGAFIFFYHKKYNADLDLYHASPDRIIDGPFITLVFSAFSLQLMKRISQHNLDHDETILAAGVTMLLTDQVKMREPHKVSRCLWDCVECLRYVLRRRRPDQPHIFARIVEIIVDFRSIDFNLNTIEKMLNTKLDDTLHEFDYNP